ncbi:NTP transferase domain-containing protein, partial [candidate division KSB1 bacterium]|nr:NTP transferase domain-containing protein [candidate division KSB1 bacterium]
MIAVILAGGKGTRLGETGRYFPKPLIPIGAEPVINHLVDKISLLPGIEKIYILTRKVQIIDDNGSKNKLDFKTAYERWREVWYSNTQIPLEILYQEDLDPLPTLKKANGAIAALCQFERSLKKNHPSYDYVLVVAGDNFIEDDLTKMIALAKTREYSSAVINAYFDFRDKEKIRQKYGCLEVDGHNWVTSYEEKPEDPSIDQTKASTAVYLFPQHDFRRLNEYSKNYPYGMDAPGNFLKWLVKDIYPYDSRESEQLRDQGKGVKGYKLEGEWFDIG